MCLYVDSNTKDYSILIATQNNISDFADLVIKVFFRKFKKLWKPQKANKINLQHHLQINQMPKLIQKLLKLWIWPNVRNKRNAQKYTRNFTGIFPESLPPKRKKKKIELKKAEEALAKFNNDPNAAALSILTSGL